MKISIVIPAYQMYGLGGTFISECFDSLKIQKLTDFEVIVVDDQSEDHTIKQICKNASNDLDIKYIIYHGCDPFSAKANLGISESSGDIIKFICQDDYLSDAYSLATIADNFDNTTNWLVTACNSTRDRKTLIRKYIPYYNHGIHLGKNTIGCTSVLAIRNKNPIKFDEKLSHLPDCEYYKRLYERYGDPKILHDTTVIIGLGDHQTTEHMTADRVKIETAYVIKKYE